MTDLTQEEINVLIQILNQVPISGVENMQVVLGIVKKLAGQKAEEAIEPPEVEDEE